MVKVRKQNDMQSEYHGKSELLVSENSLISYNQFIVREFIRFSKSDSFNSKTRGGGFRTLDFGAGYGTLARIWLELTGQKVECLEIDSKQRKEIEARGFVCWQSIAAVKGEFKFIFSSNVLEHIENDEESLKELVTLLEHGGRIGIYVPAFMVLFSDLDTSVGHYRRYSRKELMRKVEGVGLNVIHCNYVDSLGFFASLVIRVFGWKSIGNIGGASSLKFYDAIIFPVSRLIDKITCGRVLGKNLLLIAEK